MSVNIQTSNGLKKIADKTTKKTIKEALGYIPVPISVEEVKDEVKKDVIDIINTSSTYASRVIFDDGVSLAEKYAKGELGSGGGGGGLIEVDELPSVGVEGVIYKLNGAPDVYAVAGTSAMSMIEMLAYEGMAVTVEIVDTLPTENIKTVDMTTGAVPLYYSKQDSKVWGYMDGTWVDFLLFMFKVDLTAQLVYGLENITYPTTEGEILAYVVVPSELYKYTNGEYVKIDKLPVINSQEWLGTKVPNYGTVENVYFNTELSVEEVVSLISGLIYYTLENQPITYSILASSDWLHTLNITNENGNYTILKYNRETNDLTIIWTNYEYSGDNLSGWREVAKNAISFECEVTNTGGTFDVGAENDKITSLFSTTPFTKQVTLSGEYVSAGTYEFTGNQLIDLTATYLKDKEIPLKIKINVDKAEWVLNKNFITEISNETIETIKDYTFYNAGYLKSVDLPNVTYVGTKAFYGCSSLTDINMPNIENIRADAFAQCLGLTKMKLPNLTTIKDTAFCNCFSLKTLDLGSGVSTFSFNIISMCYSLTKLVIRYESQVIALNSTFVSCYHFDGTVDATYNPNGDKDGYIYVPDSLVEQYKVAENWSTYASQIKPLSEYKE